MRIIQHLEVPFPDDLEGRLDSVLNLVNNELRLISFLFLEDDELGPVNLRRKIVGELGTEKTLPSFQTIFQYFKRVLIPLGFAVTRGGQYSRYSMSNAGKRYGRAAGIISLESVLKNQRSMYSVLGKTGSSSKSRSPLNRIKILNLIREGPKKEADLAGPIGLPESDIREHLKALHRIKFIDFAAYGEITGRKGDFVYEWVSGKDPSEISETKENKIMTLRVARTLQKIGRGDRYSIAGAANYKSVNYVSSILVDLRKRGFAIGIKWRAREKYTEVSLLQGGRVFLEEVYDKLVEIVRDKGLLKLANARYGEVMGDLRTNRNLFVEAAKIYRGVSYRINAHPTEETLTRMVQFVKSNPGARPCEISLRLGIRTPTTYLASLINSGQLRKEKLGRKTSYHTT